MSRNPKTCRSPGRRSALESSFTLPVGRLMPRINLSYQLSYQEDLVALHTASSIPKLP
jgi:hypothetical protein